MTRDEAWKLAEHWIAAWNAHDLDLIMTHYEDAIELTSPVVAQLLGRADGKVIGKANLEAYFRRGLEAYPELHFHQLPRGFPEIRLGLRSGAQSFLAANFLDEPENSQRRHNRAARPAAASRLPSLSDSRIAARGKHSGQMGRSHESPLRESTKRSE